MSDSISGVQPRKISLFNLKGDPMLTVRQRFIYGRLAPLRRPMSAAKLSESLGGLIDRHTVSRHLVVLKGLGLVEERAGGWVALEPTAELDGQFVRLKPRGQERWHGAYAGFNVALPAEQPFPGQRNAAELYTLYWLIWDLQRQSKTWTIKGLTALLGLSRTAVRRMVMELKGEGLIGDDGKVCRHRFKLQCVDETPETPDQRDALDVLVDRLSGGDTINELTRAVIAANLMTRSAVYKLCQDALKAHRAGSQSGDGSALIVYRLRERLTAKTAADAGRAAEVRAGRLQDDARRLRQLADAVRDRCRPQDRDRLDVILGRYTLGQLDAADMALEKRRGLTADDIEAALGGQFSPPSTAPSSPSEPIKVVVLTAPEADPLPEPTGPKTSLWGDDDDLAPEDWAELEREMGLT